METLSIALVIALGWALSYRAKWRRAERQMAHIEQTGQFRARLNENQWRTVDAAYDRIGEIEERLADMTRKRDDAWRRYLDALDENAFLRSGGAAE